MLNAQCSMRECPNGEWTECGVAVSDHSTRFFTRPRRGAARRVNQQEWALRREFSRREERGRLAARPIGERGVPELVEAPPLFPEAGFMLVR